MCDNDNMFDNEVTCPIDGESYKNENFSNSEDVTDIIDIEQNTDQSTSIHLKHVLVTIITKNNQKLKILLNMRF